MSKNNKRCSGLWTLTDTYIRCFIASGDGTPGGQTVVYLSSNMPYPLVKVRSHTRIHIHEHTHVRSPVASFIE